jgi:DNA 3'-phosphatase
VYKIVVISNQGGVSLKPNTKAPKAHTSKVASFKEKVSAVFNQLDFPISIYAATEKDIYRKPRTGMWAELLDNYDIQPDLEQSIFVGDAGGRHADGGKPKDFSCSDRYGIKFRFAYKCLHKIGTLRRTSVLSFRLRKSSFLAKHQGRSHVHSNLRIIFPILRLKVRIPAESHSPTDEKLILV